MADKRLIFLRGSSACVCCKATSAHDRPCRAKGQWHIRLFGPSHQTLACCPCLSHRSRYPTALTHRRPQSDGALREESPGRARDKNARLCAQPPAASATPMAPAGVSGLWPLPPARASAAAAAAPAALLVWGACDPAFLHSLRHGACGRDLGLVRGSPRCAMRPPS
jgi:hypothetical protein